MADELVHYAVADEVATITLDSPHNRNALSAQLVRELGERLERAEADEAAKVVLLRAEGTVFCSGADLSEASTGAPEDAPRGIVRLQRMIVGSSKPVVLRLQGAVRAGGIGLVAAADVVVANEDATFALTEVKLGLAPAVISLTVLPRLTSRAAAYTFLTGETFTGAEAERMGLVTRAVPADGLDAEVERVCASLATGAVQGLRETKALLAHDLLERIDRLGDDVAAQSARLFGSAEAREAMTAFLARKK
ncbi:enoyl-CoA hydratase family protein [Nocardioides deserti]|uniref:Enoyl-CoA hydratase family protein n=1 Tax=Nocardioides deserti TaxID=1588644 RepID=A0ABR6U5H4_9ACTN|nr:enoyl-CoA hydratase family protein [Nocardioides deserti]MBC2959667.1 enoyl-CoA hydratase family protein [Nocardioides deserti]GGO74212.1 putative enoyl-CoA hydratase/isomerase [Nocardioides deserti]